MNPEDNDAHKLRTNSGPWALEVESMTRTKTEKRITDVHTSLDTSSRRFIKGRRRIRRHSNNDHVEVNLKGMKSISKSSCISITPSIINKKVLLKPSPVNKNDISGINAFDISEETLVKKRKSRNSKIDSPLIISRNSNTLQHNIFTKHIKSPISNNLTAKRRTRRNTYDLQDTVNDLEILVNESPAKYINSDEKNGGEKTLVHNKKKMRIPGTNTQRNTGEFQNGTLMNESFLVMDVNSSENEAEKLRVNKKKKVKKSKRNNKEPGLEDDNVIEPLLKDFDTNEKSLLNKKKESLENLHILKDGLLMNESSPSNFVSAIENDTESSLIDQKEKCKSKKQKKHSDTYKSSSENDIKMQIDEKQVFDSVPKNNKKKSNMLQDSLNTINLLVTNSPSEKVAEPVNISFDQKYEKDSVFEVDSIIPGKKRKSGEAHSLIETVTKCVKSQKRSTFKIKSPIEKSTEKASKKRNTFEIDSNVHDKQSQKRNTFEIDSNVHNEQSQEINTIEIDPNVHNKQSQKRNTFEIDPQIHDKQSQKRNTFEIDPNVCNKQSQKRNSFVIDSDEQKSITERSQKRGTFEIDSNVGSDNEKSQKRSTFETDPNVSKSSDGNTKKRSTFEIDPNDSLIQGMKRKSKEIEPDESASSEHLFRKRSTFEMKPIVSVTKRRRRRGIYEPQRAVELSDDVFNSASVNTSSCGVFQLPSPWKDQSSNKTSDGDTEIEPQNIFQKPKILTPVASEKKSTTKTSSQVKKSGSKMPNYSLIHKKVFDRMESLEDHLERKKARANALLSGSKVKIGITSKINTPNIKKQLFLNKPQENTPNKLVNSPKTISSIKNIRVDTPFKMRTDKTPTKMMQIDKTPFKLMQTDKTPIKMMRNDRTPIRMMKMDKTPMKNKPEKENRSPANFNTITKGRQTPIENKVTEISKWLNRQKVKSPLKTQFGNKPTKKSTPVKFPTPIDYSIKNRVQTPFKTITKKAPKKVTPSKSNLPVINRPVIPMQPGMTRFGFKMNQDVKNVKDVKEQAIKAVATKSRTQKNMVKERRNYIKGVRSNRRFDLLMNMRQMQKE